MSGSNTCKFEARIRIVDGTLDEVVVWVYELEPDSDSGSRLGAEWVAEHLRDYSVNDLLERLELPTDKDVQAIFKGTICGWRDEFSGEWDEDIDDITDVQWAVIR